MMLVMMILAAAAVLFGLLSRQAVFVTMGAAVHLLAGIAGLFHAYRVAKLLRGDALQENPEDAIREISERSLSDRAAEWVDGAITFTGLVLVVITMDRDDSGFAIGGSLIWFGSVACYFVSGIIAREVGGIPLSMGYGGWKVRRDRHGRIRR